MPTLATVDAVAPAKLGAVLMITAGLAFSIMTAMIRKAGQELPPIEIAFLRNLFGALFMAPFFFKHGLRIFHTNRPTMHILRSGFGFVGMVSWFTAITLLPLAQAVALNFTGPLFATVIAALILHEIVRMRRWSATIIGFIGVLIVLRPGQVPFSLGAGLALLSALSFAINLVLLRAMGRTERPATIVAITTMIQIPLTAIPMAWLWVAPSWQVLVLCAAIGGLGTFGHLCLSRALALADTSALVPLDFIRMPFIIVIGYLFFAELPDIWTVVGALIIICSAAYIGHRESQLAHARIPPSRP